jgi:hypothetical protein
MNSASCGLDPAKMEGQLSASKSAWGRMEGALGPAFPIALGSSFSASVARSKASRTIWLNTVTSDPPVLSGGLVK